MANSKHVEVLEKGIEAWNSWRKKNPSIKPDLQLLDFHDLKLPEVKGFPQKQEKREMSFQEAIALEKKFPWYIQQIDLHGIDFSNTVLAEVNLDHVYLEGVDLTNTTLELSRLRESILDGANLNNANLTGADLRRAFLNGATIEEADLTAADFSYGVLRHASLQDSLLSRTIFVGADLREASFKNASFDATVLGGAMLKGAIGIESSNHYGPSIVDPQTVYRSGGLPKRFLRGCGWPDHYIDYIPSLINQPIQYYSCFISHSSKDAEFTQRLHADLQNNGIRCWYAPEDMKIGDKLRTRIDEVIRLHDKLLLVLSDQSINSDWVEKEVETAFEKERVNKETVLFPVRLDVAAMHCDTGWAADIRRTRHIGDFQNWKDHNTYKKSLDRLLRDLKYSNE